MAGQEKKWIWKRRNAVPPQYRRKSKGLKITLWVLSAVLVCAVLVMAALPKLLPMLAGTQETVATAPPPPDRVIHIVAGGDVNITDKTVAAGLAGGRYDYTEVFKDVLPVLSRGDVAVLNFEGVVSGNSYGTATKAAPGELLNALSTAGVDVLQTANSASIIDGLRGLQRTLQEIQGAGMTPVGTFESNAAFDQSGGYLIWEVQGIKVAIMAFTKGMDGMGLPLGGEKCVNLLYTDYNSTYQKVNKQGITQVVRNAAAHEPDVMVALVHWGSEFNDQISKTQEKICDILQQEGVDAIIGTHSHYVQKMEFDREKGTFVAYSLGDFFGEGEIAGTNYSVLLDLEITKDGKTGQTKVTGFEYVPIFIERGENGALRLLRIREAMLGYENQFLGRVSQETYLSMQNALERIKSRIGLEA